MEVGGSKITSLGGENHMRTFLVEGQGVSKTRSLANRTAKTWKERPGLNYNRNSRSTKYIIAGHEGAGFQRQKKHSWKMPVTKGKLDK